MKFTRKDLLYNNYSWSADGGDDPHYKKYLDRIKVDKTEGYEVVYFCNDFLVENKKSSTKEDFQRVERLLRKKDFSNIQLRTELNEAINKIWNTVALEDILKKF